MTRAGLRHVGMRMALISHAMWSSTTAVGRLVLGLDGFPWVNHEPVGGLVTGELTHTDAAALLGVWWARGSAGLEGRIPMGDTREAGFVVVV